MQQNKEKKEEADQEQVVECGFIFEYVKHEWKIIAMCLVVLLMCMYVLYNIGDFQQRCNEHWEGELERCSCVCGALGDNASFNRFEGEPDYTGIFKGGGR